MQIPHHLIVKGPAKFRLIASKFHDHIYFRSVSVSGVKKGVSEDVEGS